MKDYRLRPLFLALAAATVAGPPPLDASPPWFAWTTVVNNKDFMPTEDCESGIKCRHFNSYNQPSVNVKGLVVIRARSKGGGGGESGGGESGGGEVGGGEPGGGGGHQPIHGIYTRDMSVADSPIVKILDRATEVPQPNNLATTFVETPSFPRVDMWSDTIATRGNHQPVWRYLLDDGSETRAGTTGIYANPFGKLVTGTAKLGAIPDFGFLAVPGVEPPIMFDVFPGSPAVTKCSTIVFKGNYTVDEVGRTGVFFRRLEDAPIPLSDGSELAPAAGVSPVVLIANNTDTFIPGTRTVFGSTSPPSAAGRRVVFAGFDNEEQPTLGGIYLAPLQERPKLRTLVRIGQRVPSEPVSSTFNGLGEGGAFDGRYVGFWGSWGTETRTERLYCPQEGNKDRIAYCNQSLVCSDTGEIIGDPNSVCDDTSDPNWPICYQEREVPVHQGIFVNDTKLRRTRAVAKTGNRFDDFLFWNYSGKVPCVGGGHSEEGGEDDGEPARWRSSAFVAVSGRLTAYKATGDDVVGIYLNKGLGQQAVSVLDTQTDGQSVDPEAPIGSLVTEVGLEREGLRGRWLAVSAKMGIEGGTEEDGMAGVYITRLPRR